MMEKIISSIRLPSPSSKENQAMNYISWSTTKKIWVLQQSKRSSKNKCSYEHIPAKRAKSPFLLCPNFVNLFYLRPNEKPKWNEVFHEVEIIDYYQIISYFEIIKVVTMHPSIKTKNIFEGGCIPQSGTVFVLILSIFFSLQVYTI